MSLKCSLLGHRFGETTVERDREEEGTEAVITITEFETCTRCGETRVVSENKEVTTLETPAESGSFQGAGGPASDSGPDRRRDAEILDDDGQETTVQADARTEEATIPDAESDRPGETDAGEGDAVIIDDADEDGPDDDREPGEWPEEADRDDEDPVDRAGESAEVEILGDDTDDSTDSSGGQPGAPDADATPGAPSGAGASGSGSPSGRAADSPGAGQADRSGAGPAEPTAGVDSGTAAWPKENDNASLTGQDAIGDWPDETKPDEPADSGAADLDLDGENGAGITVPEGMFKCTECGYTTGVESSSLRAGDFCPECRRGTLAQHDDSGEQRN